MTLARLSVAGARACVRRIVREGNEENAKRANGTDSSCGTISRCEFLQALGIWISQSH